MDYKRLLIGTVVGAVALYVAGWLIFEQLFAGFYETNLSLTAVGREADLEWSIIVGSVLFAIMIAAVIELLPGPKSIGKGLLAGFLVGLLHWGAADYTFYGFMNFMTLTVTLIDPVVEGVHAAIAGGVVAIVLGMIGGSRPAAA